MIPRFPSHLKIYIEDSEVKGDLGLPGHRVVFKKDCHVKGYIEAHSISAEGRNISADGFIFVNAVHFINSLISLGSDITAMYHLEADDSIVAWGGILCIHGDIIARKIQCSNNERGLKYRIFAGPLNSDDRGPGIVSADEILPEPSYVGYGRVIMPYIRKGSKTLKF